MVKKMPKVRIFLAQNENNGNKMCMTGTKVYWHDHDAKYGPLYIATTF
jgi:hypothetical protein